MEHHTTFKSISPKVFEMAERQLIGFSASVTVLCGSLERVLFLVIKTSFAGFSFKVKSLHF